MARNDNASSRFILFNGSACDSIATLRAGASASPDMTKKYEFIREKVRLPNGAYAEAMRVAIVEFSCLGERHFDIAGDPYQSEEEALGADWDRLADDAKAAATRLKTEIESAKELSADVGTKRQVRR